MFLMIKFLRVYYDGLEYVVVYFEKVLILIKLFVYVFEWMYIVYVEFGYISWFFLVLRES